MNLIELNAQRNIFRNFTHEAHDSIGQKRKYSGNPYYEHTDEVESIVVEDALKRGLPYDKIVILSGASHFHDIFEDVFPNNPNYSPAILTAKFGEPIVKVTIELTDVYIKESYPNLNRAQRKAKERERIEQTSPEAQTIKLADLISNTRSIVAEDPDFARVYLREKLELLGCLTQGSPELLGRASTQALECMAKLGMTMPLLMAPTPS